MESETSAELSADTRRMIEGPILATLLKLAGPTTAVALALTVYGFTMAFMVKRLLPATLD